MTRWIVVSGLALALVLPLVGEAVADGMAPRKRVYANKRCIAPAMWFGRGQTTWVCTAAQKCCYDRLLRKGTCLDATARCF